MGLLLLQGKGDGTDGGWISARSGHEDLVPLDPQERGRNQNKSLLPEHITRTQGDAMVLQPNAAHQRRVFHLKVSAGNQAEGGE